MKFSNRLKSIVFIYSVSVIFLIISLIYLTQSGKPKVGDCVDVTKYGQNDTPRYCKVTGDIQRVSITDWSFSLDGTTCKFYLYRYCTAGEYHPESCHDGRWRPLTGANTIDGKIVSDSLCQNN